MSRFDKLLARYLEKKHGSISADLMIPINAHYRVEDIKRQLQMAEMELAHAKRGIDHSDYNVVFDGWDRCK